MDLNPRRMYRLPWSLTDNGISWLEVTSKCNLACKGCYRDRDSTGHKSLSEIEDDLVVFKRERKSDCMSIAGGDPLVHPEIVKIVGMVKRWGWKPIVNTNGLALTSTLLRDLKNAGMFGFTFHVDTSQKRSDSLSARVESDHNCLRERLARLLAAEGGIACSFNQTVTFDTLDQIPDVVRWAQAHVDVVNTMVFILYRDPQMLGDFDYYAKGTKVDLTGTYEKTNWGNGKTLKAPDVVEKIREADPLYQPCAYLNGTVDPKSMKWLLGLRVGTSKRTYGYATAKFLEAIQNASHFTRGKWLSYSRPSFTRHGRSSALLFAPIDKGMREASGRLLKTMVRSPAVAMERAYMQTYMVIQPIDFLPDGRMNMCDSCPDMTVHEGKLYWSCRLEEIKRYGSFVTAVPKAQGENRAGGPC